MPGFDLAVFDLAGTTVRDGGQVAEAFRSPLRGVGLGLPDEELRPWGGASKRRALRHFLEQPGAGVTPERLEEIYALFRDRRESRRSIEADVTSNAGLNHARWISAEPSRNWSR
jgi:hypothetical protein